MLQPDTPPESQSATLLSVDGVLNGQLPDGSIIGHIVGDTLVPGELLMPSAGAQVRIQMADGRIIGLPDGAYLTLEQAAALDIEEEAAASPQALDEPVLEQEQEIEAAHSETEAHNVEPTQEGSQNTRTFGTTPVINPAVNFLSPPAAEGTALTGGITPGISGSSLTAANSETLSASREAEARSSDISRSRTTQSETGALFSSLEQLEAGSSGQQGASGSSGSTGTSGSGYTVTPSGPGAVDNTAVQMSLQNDSGTVRIGAKLQYQQGLLSNDTLPEGARITAVDGVTIAAQGQTVVQGDMGALTISANGEYSYNSHSVDYQDGMMGQWTFDSLNGNILADTGSDGSNDEDLTNSGGQLVTGLSGTALSVSNGQYASVTAGSESEIFLGSEDLEGFTMALAFKAGDGNDFSGRQVLFSHFSNNLGVSAYIDNGTLYVGGAESATTRSFMSFDLSSTSASDWHQITLTYSADEGNLNAYFDGQAMTGSPGTLANLITEDPFELTLGASTGGIVYHDGASSATNGFNGLIDEVRFYNRTLEAGDVTAMVADQLGTTLEEDFTYTVTDANGNTSTAELNLVLQKTHNHLPTIEDQSLYVAQAQSAAAVSAPSLGLLGGVTDADGDTVTLANVDGTVIARTGTTNITGSYGTLVVAADGTYSYVPLNSATAGGTDTFNVVVSDGHGQTSSTLTVNVLASGFASHDSATVYESEADDSILLMFDGSRNAVMGVNTETGVGHTLYSGNQDFIDITVGSNNTVYGITSSQVVSIDISNGTASTVVSHSITQVRGVTVAPNGTMYVVDANGIFYSLNLTTGASASIGNIGGTPVGGMAWHSGEAYIYTSESGGKLIKVDLASAQVATVASGTGEMTGLTSKDGKLIAANEDGDIFQVNPSTGTTTELVDSLAQEVSGVSQLAFGQAEGNILSNDNAATFVTQVMGVSGQNTVISSTEVTVVAGAFGNLHIRSNGTYSYHVDNSKAAFDDLDQGQTANDRFVYTATNANNQTAQSVLTMFVSGATEVSVANVPSFTGALKTYVFSDTDASEPVTFNFDAGSGQKITGIRITGHENGSLSSPTALSNSGTISSEYDSWSWSVTPGNNAGLQSFNGDGLTLSSVTDGLSGNLHIEVTVSSYNSNGTLADSWTSTVPLDARVVFVDDTTTGDSANNTLTGTADNDALIGGAGNDILTGGDGMNVFSWDASHAGTVGQAAIDTVTDFTTGTSGDVLDLADLVPTAVGATNLDEYLSFNFANGNTTIDVSASAGGATVQQIVLQGVDLSQTYGTTDATTLINNLTDDGNLMT